MPIANLITIPPASPNSPIAFPHAVQTSIAALQSIATYMPNLLSSRQFFRAATSLARAPLRPRIAPTSIQLSRILQQQTAKMATKMAERLKGKTIVITGASSGIGKSTAIEFARTQPDDLKLILTARREDTLKELAQEIQGFAKGVKVLPVKLDVSKPDEVQGFVGNLPQEYKDIDVLVNNAYVITPLHTLVRELTDISAAL
jgi:FlaA1/EpsC-like NDP-sugar epimerase